MKLTIHTKLELDSRAKKVLEEVACNYNKIKRDLFSDVVGKKRTASSFKNEYLKKYKITARQFNSIRIDLDGVLRSNKELQKLNLKLLKERISSLKKYIKDRKKKLKKKIGHKFAIHQKQRKLASVTSKLLKLQDDVKNDKVRLCFGSKKLFSKQFHLKKNGYSSHDEWKKDWHSSRNSSFFLVGSKDETCGNQSCQLSLDGSLKIRLPNALVDKYGKHLLINNVVFNYKQDQLQAALARNSALSHKFVFKNSNWYLHTSFLYEEIKTITMRPNEIGAIGVDFNALNVATAQIDRFGNYIDSKSYKLNIRDKRKNKTLAIFGDCSKAIVQEAYDQKKPIVIERLDFTKKRSAL